ncbi:MAG: glycosyltransferase [Candidatus Omnitrophota bacterium]
MKICMISPYYPPNQFYDGIGDYTQKLCEEMLKAGHEITVLASTGYEGVGSSHDPIKIVPFASRWGFGTFLKLFRLCRTKKFDVVNLQYSPPLYGIFFKMLFPLIGLASPAVVTLHTLIGGGPVNKMVALTFVLFCAEIISTNEEISYLVRKRLPWKKNLVQIPIGSAIIPPGQGETSTMKEKEGIVLAHFGLFYPGKGVETILKAVAELKKEYNDFRLIMLGGEWRGAEDYYDGLKKQAQQLGIDEKVSWLGYLPAEGVSEQLSVADIFLVPYDRGISIRRSSFMVGLAHSLPIISTYAKIKSEYLKENENIALVPPGDAVALKEKILELIQDPDKRKRLREGAKSLMEEFRWPKIASKMIQVFEKVKC